MKVTFIGATHEVTGSCTLLEVGGQYILIDCGMEQGADRFENADLPVLPAQISAVLLTHAHIDHSGKLPLLYKNGFKGRIYATEETCNLARIMLLDSAHIQEGDAERKTRKARRSGQADIAPLYTVEDVTQMFSAFSPVSYGEQRQLLEGITVRFTDIGHLLGSAAIEIWMTEGDETKKIVFSGDVGNTNQPIIKDPSPVLEADYLVIESTYGNRLHDHSVYETDMPAYMAQLMKSVFDKGGNVVIPSFSVGRTQEILYFIREIKERRLIPDYAHFPVYLDSPLGEEATGIFMQCNTDCLDEKTLFLVKQGINPLFFPNLNITSTAEESRAINFNPRPKVIIASSGMCEAGRIRHHLKHNLWRPECLILFTGFQAPGTTGRLIYDGAKTVRLFDEEISVSAQIHLLPNISGHADRDGLLAWIASFTKMPVRIFVNHGDDDACTAFSETIRTKWGIPALAPYSGTTYDLLTDSPVLLTEGIPIKKAYRPKKQTMESYARLLAAADALKELVHVSDGLPNRDMARMTSDIERLLEKWR